MARLELDRRGFLTLAAGGGVALLVGRVRPAAAYAPDDALREAMQKSPLAYISPLKSDGNESRCHAEIWFVADGDDLVVVTAADGWRARAVKAGLGKARAWVGDHGVWTVSKGAYKQSPSCVADASVESDPANHARLLSVFGEKYPDGWGKWGPRFENGLKDGSRVMIRYRPSGA